VQGGVSAAAYLLFSANRTPRRSTRSCCASTTGDIHLSVSDEGALIDLNSAQPEMLTGLFNAVGGKSLSGRPSPAACSTGG